MRILITGANGFVGNSLESWLEEQGYQLYLASRNGHSGSAKSIAMGNIETFDEWNKHLVDIDIVIHLAARVHQMDDEDNTGLLYQRTNVEATVRLAEAAAECRIKRFIFLSTIKVNGEATLKGEAFLATDPPAPQDAYGESKLQAELALKKIASSSAMELVIIRPPLVYGPGVKANFSRLVELAQGGMPVPFAGISNYRNMVSVNNLCDLIAHCIDNPRAAGGTFLVSDDKAYSTADIIREVRSILGLPHRLFYFPPDILKLLLTLVGKRAVAERLLSNIEVDITLTTKTLDWTPKYTLQQTLKKMLT